MSSSPLPTSSESEPPGRQPPVSPAFANVEPGPPSSATALLTVLRDALMAGTHTRDEILLAIADTGRTLTGANGTAIALRTHGVVVCRARSGEIAPQLGAALNVDSGISGECFRTSSVLRCDDTQADVRVEAEVCRSLGIRSIAVVPLRDAVATVGILEVFSNRAYAFSDEQIGLLKSLGEIAEAAAGDGTHRAVLRRLAIRMFERALQFPPARSAVEIAGLAERDTVLAAKGERPLADQQHVARPLHHGTRRPNRVAWSKDARHRARPAFHAVHDAGVHLLRSGTGVHAAAAGIEQRVVFERCDGFSDSVQGAAVRGKNVTARRQGAAQAVMI